MADRQPLKLAPVGSLTWITNERSNVLQLGDQDFEDFAFSARSDLEWLNEHMADIFERSPVDMAELLKTPGRLRGKTPQTTRKRLGPVEPFADVFGSNNPAAVLPASDHRLHTSLTQLPNNSARAGSAREKSPGPKSPNRLLRKQQDAPQKMGASMHDSGIGFSQPEGLPSQVSDSGIWSASSEFASQQPAFSSQEKSTPPPLPEPVEATLPTTLERVSDGRRTTQQSFRTAQEEGSSDRPQSPVQSATKSPKKIPENQKFNQQPPIKPVPLPKKPVASAPTPAPEPRRSGRLRNGHGSTDSELSQNEDEVAPPSSPPVARQEPLQPEASIAMAKLEHNHPVQPLGPSRAAISSRLEERQLKEDPPTPSQTTPVSERSASGSPEEPTIRKSILNFAPLPAREPLTNKKKSLGVRATREGHIEQLRSNGTNRASWLNRKGNGKSLGATSRQVEQIANRVEAGEEDVELEEPQRGSKRKGEQQDTGRARKRSRSINPSEVVDLDNDSHGETERTVALHNKTSTQRLHAKIQQLGKLNATREARSASVLPTDPSYPDLSRLESDRLTRPKSFQQDELSQPATKGLVHEIDVGVEKALTPSDLLPKPKLARSNTEPQLKYRESAVTRPISPKKSLSKSQPSPIPASASAIGAVTLGSSNSTSSVYSPTKLSTPPSPQKASSEAQHENAHLEASSSPTRTPGDGAIFAVKSHTASVFKKAKEMLLKSSVASASAKVESLSPALRSWQDGHALKQVMSSETSNGRAQSTAKPSGERLYPNLETLKPGQVLTGETSVKDSALDPLREGGQVGNSRSKEVAGEDVGKAAIAVTTVGEPVKEGCRTRSSTSQEAATQEESVVPAVLLKSPKKLKNAAREEELRQVREQRRKHQEEMLRKEKEELRRRQQEEAQREREREKEVQQKKAREAALEYSSEQQEEDEDEDEDAMDRDANCGRIGSSTEPERPSSRLQRASKFQKPTENKRPLRPTKETAKTKPAPVSIRIGTASQREMQDQRNKMTAPSSSTLISALKSSFEPSQSQTSNFSQSSLQSSASATSLRGASNAGVSKQLKSLTAAANQLKKEQEEKERKLAAKREIERRRQENQRRQNQEEEQRKMKQKPTQPVPQSAKTLSRIQSVANLRQKSEEPENKRFEHQSKALGLQKAALGKRALQQDPSSDDQQYPRLAPPRPGGPAYQQEGAKKRRTGEFEEQPSRSTKEMAPPIMQSVAKKELTSKSTLPHGYAPAPASQLATSSVPSMLRPPTKPTGSSIPNVESVKFSKDKIKFANTEAAGPTPGPATFKTPGTAKSMKSVKTPAGVKESPIYQNGELIDLPEIPTDSEDEDEDDTGPKDNFRVPNWAESPELRQLLRQQQAVNPEEVFGPMARLDMEAIFHPRTDRQAARFRSRTSSANWSGADRLTPAEIEADQEARRRMIEQGGWVFSSGL